MLADAPAERSGRCRQGSVPGTFDDRHRVGRLLSCEGRRPRTNEQRPAWDEGQAPALRRTQLLLAPIGAGVRAPPSGGPASVHPRSVLAACCDASSHAERSSLDKGTRAGSPSDRTHGCFCSLDSRRPPDGKRFSHRCRRRGDAAAGLLPRRRRRCSPTATLLAWRV